ncbi:MAG: penicillin-binding transpeptidase domain-containing protein [Brevinematales bacterium]|nr:penicillin-binding transpeptidase domain-containing protein [Brevinematales bacterium]
MRFLFLSFTLFCSNLFSLDIDFLSEIKTPYLILLKDCEKDEWIIEIDEYNLKYKTFSLGSLIKIFTIISKFKNRSVDIEERHRCNGFNANDYSVCWLKDGHKELSLIPAFAQSCNSYFYYFAKEIDFKLFLEVLREWDLYYGIENKGRVILNREEEIAAMIGKNNFIKIRPIDFFIAMENFIFKKKYLPEDLYKVLISAMNFVYINGTVREVREKLYLSSSQNIICKTGTGQYEKDGKPDIRKVNGFFVGCLNNRFLCFVMIENTRGIVAAEVGLKIFKNILSEYN